jgi:hypothetical protein
MDRKNRRKQHDYEHEHRRKRLSTSRRKTATFHNCARLLNKMARVMSGDALHEVGHGLS